MMSEERSVLAAQNAIGSSTPMNLMDNWPEVEKEFTEARRSALQKIKGRKSTDGERRERTEYWDRLAEAALQLLHEHISAQLHSTAFVSGALNTVQWLVVSDDEDAKAYDQLGEVMTNTKEEQLRHGILKALILFSKRHPDIFESFAHDSDIRVSQLSLYWLVTSGQSNFLPSYVHQTWRLYGSGLDSPKPIVVVARDLPSLLLELIPESGSLFSEQSQLQWLEKNLVKLQWDKANKIYSLKEEKKQNR